MVKLCWAAWEDRREFTYKVMQGGTGTGRNFSAQPKLTSPADDRQQRVMSLLSGGLTVQLVVGRAAAAAAAVVAVAGCSVLSLLSLWH